LNNERRNYDTKRTNGKDEAVSIGEPHYGPLIDGGILRCLHVFFVPRWRIARQGSIEAYGGYDELFHGFWEQPTESRQVIAGSRRQSEHLILLASSTLTPGRSSSRSNSGEFNGTPSRNHAVDHVTRFGRTGVPPAFMGSVN
jgi:hypothetical protein